MKKRMLQGFFALCLLFGAGDQALASPRDRTPQPLVGGTIVYVDKDAPTGGDGSSWATAFTFLQDALDCVRNGTYAHCTTPGEIWVAAGVYYPDQGSSVLPDDTTEAFYLIEDIALYGGFDGVGAVGMGVGLQETALSQRDYDLNKTILSGDIIQDDIVNVNGITISASDIVAPNSANVVYVDAANLGAFSSATILDGFYITAGDGVSGGGLLCSGASTGTCNPTLANLVFRGNKAEYGGAMYLQNSQPYLLNLTFAGNQAELFGGALYMHSSTYTLVNSSFQANSAQDGGAISNFFSDGSTLTNVSFEENSATSDGGAIHNDHSSLSLTDVTLLANSTTGRGGGMYSFDSELELLRVGCYGNSADEGGAIFDEINIDGSVASELTNVVFSGNTAAGDGGAMKVLIPAGNPTTTVDMRITNATSNRNSAGNAVGHDGGALHFDGAGITATIINSIFWGSTDFTAGFNEVFIADGTLTIRYSDVKNFAGFGVTIGAGGIFNQGANVISAAPQFIDFDGADGVVGTFDDNLDLQAISPAIDAGQNSAISEQYDFMGPPSVRKRDGGSGMVKVDMGAYEF